MSKQKTCFDEGVLGYAGTLILDPEANGPAAIAMLLGAVRGRLEWLLNRAESGRPVDWGTEIRALLDESNLERRKS